MAMQRDFCMTITPDRSANNHFEVVYRVRIFQSLFPLLPPKSSKPFNMEVSPSRLQPDDPDYAAIALVCPFDEELHCRQALLLRLLGVYMVHACAVATHMTDPPVAVIRFGHLDKIPT
jgi:hypothetical protein